MRCPYCGSKMIYPHTQHQTFSAGKAVAGAVVFGAVGAAAGFIGKDKKGYRCSACGSLCEKTMEVFTENGIDKAIREAKNGDFVFYNQIKEQYPNIELVIPNNSATEHLHSVDVSAVPQSDTVENELFELKRTISPKVFVPNCPVFIESAIIKTSSANDMLTFVAWNHSEKNVRSVYINVKVLDDVGDEITKTLCVYQGVSVAPGKVFPLEKTFDLNTNLAYSIQFEVEKIAFVDDSVWRNSEENQQYELMEQVEITAENFPKYNTLRAMVKEQSNLHLKNKLFQPVFEETHTQCICGFPFTNGTNCVHCGLNAELLAQMLTYDNLLSYQHTLIMQNAKNRANKTEKLFHSACDKLLNKARDLQEKNDSKSLAEAIDIFKKLPNADELSNEITECQMKLELIKAKEQEEKQRKIEEERIRKEERERIEELRKREKIAEEIRLKNEQEKKKRRSKNTQIICFAIAIAYLLFLLIYYMYEEGLL